MSRYDVGKFSPSPDQELICGICMHVLDKPKESPCRHVFCKVCIGKALQEKSKCPLCRASLKGSQLKDVLPLVQNMLNKLTLRCDNYDNGCKELIPMERYINHMACCNYVMVTCKFKDCGLSLLKLNQIRHETEECFYRDVICTQGCGLTFPWKEKESHKCMDSLVSLKDELIVKNKALESTIEDLNVIISALNSKLQEYEGKKNTSKVQESTADAERPSERFSGSDDSVFGSPTPSFSSNDLDYNSDACSDVSFVEPLSPDFEDFVSEEQNAFANEETQHAEFDPRYAASDIDEAHARDANWLSNFQPDPSSPPRAEREDDLFIYASDVAASEQVETHGITPAEHSIQTSVTVSLFGQSGGAEAGGSVHNSRKRFQRSVSPSSIQSKRPRSEFEDGCDDIGSETSVRRSRRLQHREPSPASDIPYVDVPPSASYLLDAYANDDDDSSDGSWSPSHYSQFC